MTSSDGTGDMSDVGDGTDDVGYGDAMAELEEILDALEDDDLDVDLRAARVERASALIRLCRDRISGARLQVEQVVSSLDPEE